VVKIGVLTDIEGPASTGRPSGGHRREWAIDDSAARVMGKPIKHHRGDQQAQAPTSAATLARRWRISALYDYSGRQHGEGYRI